MVDMSMYESVQESKRRGRNKAQTARHLELSRTTVRKFWDMDEAGFKAWKERAAKRKHKFDGYRNEIIELVETNAQDGVRVYVSSIYDVLEERHGKLPGTERTLRGYLRQLRESGAISVKPVSRTRRPQEDVPFGDQCQVDFGMTRIASGMAVYIFAAVLGASRARYVAVQDHPFRTVEVIRHILRAFRYFGGRVRRLVIDQDRLMTVSENNGEIRYTEAFAHFIDEQDVSVWLCRKADPESKGKVENLVKFVKTSFFSARTFETVEEIHEPLAEWLVRRANGKIHRETGRVPSVVLERDEQPAMRPCRKSIYEEEASVNGQGRKANEKGMISYMGNEYSVPDEYARGTVMVRHGGETIRVYDADTGEEIAKHRVPEGKGKKVVSAAHLTERGKGAGDAYEALGKRVDRPEWGAFLKANREISGGRYWKEQTRRLEKLLDGVSDTEVLYEAIAFCVDTNSCGVGQLKYAYEHLMESKASGLTPLLHHARPIVSARTTQSAKVAKRGVGYYHSIISLIVGGGL